jgi:hypothetical protein
MENTLTVKSYAMKVGLELHATKKAATAIAQKMEYVEMVNASATKDSMEINANLSNVKIYATITVLAMKKVYVNAMKDGKERHVMK